MPITPFLAGTAFEPDVTRAMGVAFVDACASLGLLDRADPATELIAKKIIELAKQGERDPARMHDQVVKFFSATG